MIRPSSGRWLLVTKDRRTLPLAAKVFIDELMAHRQQML